MLKFMRVICIISDNEESSFVSITEEEIDCKTDRKIDRTDNSEDRPEDRSEERSGESFGNRSRMRLSLRPIYSKIGVSTTSNFDRSRDRSRLSGAPFQ